MQSYLAILCYFKIFFFYPLLEESRFNHNFCFAGFEPQVYVSKNGQELTGRDAYRQYKKVMEYLSSPVICPFSHVRRTGSR